MDPRHCVVLVGSRFLAIDLATGASHDLMACTAEYQCFANAWSLSPDGKQILLVHAEGKHLSIVELATGEKQWTTPPIKGTDTLQSSIWLHDSQSFLISGIGSSEEKIDPYSIWRVRRDGRHEKI